MIFSFRFPLKFSLCFQSFENVKGHTEKKLGHHTVMFSQCIEISADK
jgi:hypothetical protein